MQNELSKLFAVAFTMIAIATESALFISGMVYNRQERVITAVFGLIVVLPLLWSVWRDLGKNQS